MERKTYRFGHSIAQGGFMYAHRIKSGAIQDKEGLLTKLKEVEAELGLLDVTIKIYPLMFFFFFMARPSISFTKIIEEIQRAMKRFGDWDHEFLLDGGHELQEECVRRQLKQFGFDYEKG